MKLQFRNMNMNLSRCSNYILLLLLHQNLLQLLLGNVLHRIGLRSRLLNKQVLELLGRPLQLLDKQLLQMRRHFTLTVLLFH